MSAEAGTIPRQSSRSARLGERIGAKHGWLGSARLARRGQREPGERGFKEAGERIAAELAEKRLRKGLGQPYGPKAAALGLGQATPPSRRTRGAPPGVAPPGEG